MVSQKNVLGYYGRLFDYNLDLIRDAYHDVLKEYAEEGRFDFVGKQLGWDEVLNNYMGGKPHLNFIEEEIGEEATQYLAEKLLSASKKSTMWLGLGLAGGLVLAGLSVAAIALAVIAGPVAFVPAIFLALVLGGTLTLVAGIGGSAASLWALLPRLRLRSSIRKTKAEADRKIEEKLVAKRLEDEIAPNLSQQQIAEALRIKKGVRIDLLAIDRSDTTSEPVLVKSKTPEVIEEQAAEEERRESSLHQQMKF